MSDPQDWVTTGITATVDPEDARKAAVFVAGAAIRLGWDKETLSDLLDSLGLLRPAENRALNDGIQGCPSQMSRQRHIREGRQCFKCWPGGRQTVAITGDSAPERAMIGGDAGASSHPAQASDPNLRFHERTG